MEDYIAQNKKAWEYNAYDFWIKEAGVPADRAKKLLTDPVGELKRYAGFFLQKFDEHPSWTNPSIPGEFTVIANRGDHL